MRVACQPCRTGNRPPYLPINPSDREPATTSSTSWLPARNSKHAGGPTRGRSELSSTSSNHQEPQRHNHFSGREMLERLADAEDPTSRHKRACHQGQEDWGGVAFGKSEEDARFLCLRTGMGPFRKLRRTSPAPLRGQEKHGTA